MVGARVTPLPDGWISNCEPECGCDKCGIESSNTSFGEHKEPVQSTSFQDQRMKEINNISFCNIFSLGTEVSNTFCG